MIFKIIHIDFEAAEIDEYNIPEVEIIGDLAIVKSRQTVSLTFIGNKNKIKSEGALQKDITTSDYLDILQRQSNGSWKCLVHTWQEVK